LIEGIDAAALLAVEIDTDAIITRQLCKVEVVFLPKRNRKEQREYDVYLYKLPICRKSFFDAKTLAWNATRYAKKHRIVSCRCSFRCIAIWAGLLAYLMKTLSRELFGFLFLKKPWRNKKKLCKLNL
jgi:hypothetical protein